MGQIFHASDEHTADLAVVAFQSLFATLYPDLSTVARVGADASITTVEEADEETVTAEDAAMVIDSPLGVTGVGIKVVNNSLEELREPDKSNAKPAVRILAALMLASSMFLIALGVVEALI